MFFLFAHLLLIIWCLQTGPHYKHQIDVRGVLVQVCVAARLAYTYAMGCGLHGFLLLEQLKRQEISVEVDRRKAQGSGHLTYAANQDLHCRSHSTCTPKLKTPSIMLKILSRHLTT